MTNDSVMRNNFHSEKIRIFVGLLHIQYIAGGILFEIEIAAGLALLEC